MSRQSAEPVSSDFHLDDTPARPAYWGGYRVIPDEIEFWQGRENRLHDRVVYRKSGKPGDGWIILRLAP